ncbi:MAG: DUF5372 family protein, partial [Limisphaerales bacterium]
MNQKSIHPIIDVRGYAMTPVEIEDTVSDPLRGLWREARTAPDASQAKQFFTVTHPFHPWRGQRFELIDCRRRW